jgi:hypothetical protein
MSPSGATLDRVLEVLGEHRFVWASERDLQAGVASALEFWGLTVEREVRVDARSRLDLRVDRVGIEVKVKGSWRDVLRQLERYALLDSVDALVLVTACPSHARIVGRPVGKPLHLHRVGSGL